MESEGAYRLAVTRLREIREKRGLSLRDLEIMSEGKWKACVVGSYERGNRCPPLTKLIELCAFYGSNVSFLFSREDEPSSRRVIDLRALARAGDEPFSSQISRIALSILNRRCDWNAAVLSLRQEDFESVATILNMTHLEMEQALNLRGLLLRLRSHP